MDNGAVAAAVEEEDGLPSGLERGLGFLDETGGEGRGHLLLAPELGEVLHQDLRQTDVAEAGVELHQSVFPLSGVGVALHGGRGRAQEHFRALPVGHEDGHIAGMVARGGVLLLVGSLVLLVDDDEAEVAIGEEQGGAHT